MAALPPQASERWSALSIAVQNESDQEPSESLPQAPEQPRGSNNLVDSNLSKQDEAKDNNAKDGNAKDDGGVSDIASSFLALSLSDKVTEDDVIDALKRAGKIVMRGAKGLEVHSADFDEDDDGDDMHDDVVPSKSPDPCWRCHVCTFDNNDLMTYCEKCNAKRKPIDGAVSAEHEARSLSSEEINRQDFGFAGRIFDPEGCIVRRQADGLRKYERDEGGKIKKKELPAAVKVAFPSIKIPDDLRGKYRRDYGRNGKPLLFNGAFVYHLADAKHYAEPCGHDRTENRELWWERKCADLHRWVISRKRGTLPYLAVGKSDSRDAHKPWHYEWSVKCDNKWVVSKLRAVKEFTPISRLPRLSCSDKKPKPESRLKQLSRADSSYTGGAYNAHANTGGSIVSVDGNNVFFGVGMSIVNGVTTRIVNGVTTRIFDDGTIEQTDCNGNRATFGGGPNRRRHAHESIRNDRDSNVGPVAIPHMRNPASKNPANIDDDDAVLQWALKEDAKMNKAAEKKKAASRKESPSAKMKAQLHPVANAPPPPYGFAKAAWGISPADEQKGPSAVVESGSKGHPSPPLSSHFPVMAQDQLHEAVRAGRARATSALQKGAVAVHSESRPHLEVRDEESTKRFKGESRTGEGNSFLKSAAASQESVANAQVRQDAESPAGLEEDRNDNSEGTPSILPAKETSDAEIASFKLVAGQSGAVAESPQAQEAAFAAAFSLVGAVDDKFAATAGDKSVLGKRSYHTQDVVISPLFGKPSLAKNTDDGATKCGLRKENAPPQKKKKTSLESSSAPVDPMTSARDAADHTVVQEGIKMPKSA